MATYDKEINYAESTTYFKLKERYIYGSSRVGVRNSDLDVLPLPDESVIFPYSTVISEMLVDICLAQDYSPFTSPTLVDSVRPLRLVGVTLDGRNFVVSEGYRYGFNGQEKDDEVAGKGNSYTAEFWQYDSRLGRRWNIDPVVKEFESPYATFANNPISFRDPNGADTASNASKGTGNLIVTVDPTLKKFGQAAAKEDGSQFDFIYGETIQDVEKQVAEYMEKFKLKELNTLVYHSHSGAGHFSLDGIDIAPSYSFKDYGGRSVTKAGVANPAMRATVRSFVNLIDLVKEDGTIVMKSCGTGAKNDGYSDFTGQIAVEIAKLTGYKANIYTCLNVSATIGLKLLNSPLSFKNSCNDYPIGWFLQPSCNPNGGRILEQNSIIITSSGVVVPATSELDCARGVTH